MIATVYFCAPKFEEPAPSKPPYISGTILRKQILKEFEPGFKFSDLRGAHDHMVKSYELMVSDGKGRIEWLTVSKEDYERFNEGDSITARGGDL